MNESEAAHRRRGGREARRELRAAPIPEAKRAVKPGITLSICGEHGGDPDSIAFSREAGFTYVSCSPFRVPVAKLAAAQLAVKAPQTLSDSDT